MEDNLIQEEIKRTWRKASSKMLRLAALVRSDVSEELSAYINKVTRTGELGTKQAATSNRRTLCVRFLQEPDGVTTQKTAFFIVTAVKTSNLTRDSRCSELSSNVTVTKASVGIVCRRASSRNGSVDIATDKGLDGRS
jgi:hypothetical protein